MDELPGIIIALVLIYFVIKYFFGGSKVNTLPTSDGTPTSGPLRGVSNDMISTVISAFPDQPPSSIVFSLAQTRSAQATCEIILEKGRLPEPPASFPTHPYLTQLAQSQHPNPASTNTAAPATATSSTKPSQSLIDRYGLSSRVSSLDKGKGKLDHDLALGIGRQSSGSIGEVGVEEQKFVGGKKWTVDPKEREKSLKERKEKMVLEARRKLLEKQAASKQKVV